MSVTVESTEVADTLAAGRRLAALLRPGDVVALCGPLGAGKTAFVGGVAEGLGIEETVTSPSFILLRRYDSGFLPLVHVDVYRLGSLGEFADLDVFEAADGGILVVEWGNAVDSLLPEDRLTVRIEVTGEDQRAIVYTPSGGWRGRPLQELSA